MNISYFRVIPFEKKCDVVVLATYLAYRAVGEVKVFLYEYNGFFIEVFYSVAKQKVIMINAFTGAAGLYEYVDNISLADLTA